MTNKDKKKRSFKRKIFTLVILGVAIFMALSALAVIFFPVDSLRNQIIQAVESETGFSCKIRRMHGNVASGNIGMEGLEIYQDQTLLMSIDNAELEVAITSLIGVLFKDPPVINSIKITKGKFNCAILGIDPHAKPRPSSQPSAVTEQAAPANQQGAISVEKNSENTKQWQSTNVAIKSITVSNVELYGKQSEMDMAPFVIKNGVIKSSGKNQYIFNVSLKAKKSAGTLQVEGEAKEVFFPDFSHATLSTHAKGRDINIADIYEIIGTPNLTKNFDLQSTSIDLSIISQAQKMEVAGVINAASMQAAKTPKFINPQIALNAIISDNGKTITFKSLAAKSENGFSLDTGGYIKIINKGIELNAEVKHSNLPISMLHDIIGKPEYSAFSQGHISLTGNLNNIGGFWRYKGEVNTKNIFLPMSPQRKGEVAAKVNCDQKLKMLSVKDLRLNLGLFSASGYGDIPLGADSDFAQAKLNLAGTVSLKKISLATNLFNATGDLSWQASSYPASGEGIGFSLSITSQNPIAINLETALVPIHIKEFALQTKGSYDTASKELSVSQMQLNSPLLSINANALAKPQNLSGSCTFSAQISSLYPLVERFIPAYKDQLKPVDQIASRSSYAVDFKNNSLALKDMLSSIKFSNGRVLRFSSNATSTQGASAATTLNITRYNMINNEKVMLEGSAEVTLKGELKSAGYKPDIKVKANSRGAINELISLRNIYAGTQDSVSATGTIALNAMYDVSKDDHNLSMAFNTLKPTLKVNGKQALNAQSLSGQIACSKNHTQKKIDIRKILLNADDGKILVDGSGHINALTGMSGEFTLSTNIDLERCSEIFPAAFDGAPQISGLLKSEIRLAGSLTKPELRITAKSPDIFIYSNNKGRRFINPALRCSVTWDQTKAGPRNITLNPLYFKTDNESLTIKGRTENAAIENKEVINFGKGAAFNFLLTGNRKLLVLIAPAIEKDITAAGPADALAISGTIQAMKLPLFTDNPRKILASELTLSDGRLRLDHLKAGKIDLTGLNARFSLVNGIFSVHQGIINCGGRINFDGNVDFGQIPARGEISIKSAPLKLPELARNFNNPKVRVYGGELSIPAPADVPTKISWTGENAEDIRKSLTISKSTIAARDVRIQTKMDKPDIEQFLKFDMHESVAKEIARRINEKISNKYEKPNDMYFKHFDLVYHASNGTIIIDSCNVGGGNTADFIVGGRIEPDNTLKLAIIPVRNVNQTIDLSMVTQDPTVQNFLRNLNDAQKQKIFGIIPNWLEDAAKRRKLLIPVNGTLIRPQIDPKGLRDTIIAELPALIKKAGDVLNQEDIIRGVIGNDNMKQLKNIIKNIN